MIQKPHAVVDLVLVGGGHAHVHVLKMLGMPTYRRLVWELGIQITLIAKDLHTPYSGMLPGYVAGHYSWEDIHLDLNQLARWAGVRLVHASAHQITYNNNGGGGTFGGWIHCKTIDTAERLPLIRYDVLSINVGIAPAAGDFVSSSSSKVDVVIPVKPISGFTSFFESLLSKLDARQQRDNNSDSDNQGYTLCVVGGGAGGIELALSMQYRLLQQQEQNEKTIGTTPKSTRISVILVTQGKGILESHNAIVQRKITRILKERNIRVYYECKVVRVEPHDPVNNKQQQQKRLVLSPDSLPCDLNGESSTIVADDVLWCITAGAPSWLSCDTPFATTRDGFLRIGDTYESMYHPGVFAAGDCSHMDAHPRPKAGVFAVRAGPYLVENIMRYIQNRPLVSHVPQRDFLGLLATGNQYAIASKGTWLGLEGQYLWHVKDWIDRTWMSKYSTKSLPDLQKMMQQMSYNNNHNNNWWRGRQQSPPSSRFLHSKGIDVDEFFAADPMRCGGCGAKVGSTVLARVLRSVHERQVARAQTLLKLRGDDDGDSSPFLPAAIDHDDAAIIPIMDPISTKNGGGRGVLVQSIDYFREMVTDPFVFGKLVAVHALSDVHAMGVSAASALVLAVVPFCADEAMTESTLTHLLSGVSDVLQDEGVQLVGGHTCEGLELACGLSVTGWGQEQRLLRKRGGRVGDAIVLTKPLGTGALFAADMRAKAKGEYVMEAIAFMVQSNVHAIRVASQFEGVHACTDVTGFGLAGHLLEMLMANEGGGGEDDNSNNNMTLDSIGAVLDVQSIPFLRGGLEASRNGIFSTLQPQNARNRRAVLNHSKAVATFPVEYPLLFDPQTAGGLLFFVDANTCDEFVSQLNVQGRVSAAAVIGRVVEYPEASASEQSSLHGEGGICTIGSGEAVTGQRIRIAW